MADRIDDLVGQEAYEQVIKLDKMMGDLVTKFDLTAKSALSMQAAIGDTKSLAKLMDMYKKLQAEQQKNDEIEKKLEKTIRLKDAAIMEMNLAIQEQNKQTKATIQMNQAAEGSYTKLDLTLKQLRQSYKNMSEAERESASGKEMFSKMTQLDTKIKALDATMGVHNRNVGNYTGATFQLTQVMRELPNFAQSAEIGIRSLSNNLPMLADSFGQVRKEAGGTLPALKIFASSLFSFAGLFPIVLGGLIAYSDEIIKFGKGLFSSNDQMNQYKISLDNINKAYDSDEVKTAIKNVEQLRIDIDLARQGIISKEAVVRQYNETLGATTGFVKDLDEAEQALNMGADSYIQMMLYKTAANIAMEDSAKKLVQAQKEQQQAADDLNADVGLPYFLKQGTKEFQNAYETWFKERKKLHDEKKLSDNEFFLNSEESDFYKEMVTKKAGEQLRQGAEDDLNVARDLMKKASLEAQKIGANIFGDTKEPKVKKEKKETETNRIDEVKKQYEREQNLLDIAFKKKEITEEEYYFKSWHLAERSMSFKDGLNKKEIQSQKDLNLKLEELAAEYINKLQEASVKEFKIVEINLVKQEELRKKKLKEQSAWMEEDIKVSLDRIARYQKALKDKDDKKIKDLLDIEKAYYDLRLQGIAAFAEVSSTITDRIMSDIERRSEKEIEAIDLKEQAELDAIDRLTLSDSEREERKKKVEIEAETRREKIEKKKIQDLRKFALFQKGIDVLSIISSTSLAVMNALADKTPGMPYPLKIANAIGAGVTGATQLAKVLATPLPQYELGTPEGGHIGGKAIVGEAGTELGIRPDGTMFLTPSKASVMDLPKRTEIIPHDITKDLLGATMVRLAQANQAVTLDMYQDELIEEFKRGTDKIANEIRKNRTNISIGSSFRDYVKYNQL